jgi:hypothetical protein
LAGDANRRSAISETRLLSAKVLRFIEYLAECLQQSRLEKGA